MASQLHTYPARVTWSGGREGEGSIQNEHSGQGYDLRVPTEFGGPGGALNPEELLTNAISGCYSITLGIVTKNRRIPVQSIEVAVVGTVEQAGANFVYRSVALTPTITLAAEATDGDIAAAIDMAHKADAYCIVTNAIRDKVEVSITPNVRREGGEAQGTGPVSGDQTLDTAAKAPTAETSAPTQPTMTDPNQPQADTAPDPNVSYEGSQQDEDAYSKAEDAPKPASATGSGAESASPSTSPGSDPTSNGGSTGANPENSQADDTSANSKQTGNSESMQVGAVPG